MPRNKVAWRRLIFVVLIITSLALLTVSLRQADSGPVHAIQEAGRNVLSPLQVWGARAAEPFRDGYTWITTLWSAHREAERLLAELQELQGEAIKLREQAEENERLRGLLEIRDRVTFPEGTQFEVARVIGRSPSRWEAWVQIDRGSRDGIEVGQAVVGATPMAPGSVSGKGLVGKVVSVTVHTAQVRLITDVDTSVAAKVQNSRAEGIIQGSVAGRLVMDYVDRDIPVQPKWVVITSGHGGLYPPGVPIGIVSAVGEEDVSIYKEIQVQAFVDFRVLEEVMVLILPSPKTIPTTPTTTRSSDAAGVTTAVSSPVGLLTAPPSGDPFMTTTSTW